jgi:hypothetical protein
MNFVLFSSTTKERGILEGKEEEGLWWAEGVRLESFSRVERLKRPQRVGWDRWQMRSS